MKNHLSKKKVSNQYKSHLEINSSSYLINDNVLDFRVGAEDRNYVRIGDKCLINANFIFESLNGEVLIGNNVHLGGVRFICRNKITVGNDVTMAWGIIVYDHDSHSVDWQYRKNDNSKCYEDYIKFNGNNLINKNWDQVNSKPIIIGDKVWVGFDVTILKGVTIGEGAVIGAKSVVTKNVPPWTVVAGNPARVVRNLSVSETL